MTLGVLRNRSRRMSFKKVYQYGFFFILLSLMACATPYTKVYDGPELDKTEIAILSGWVKGKGLYDEPLGWVSIVKVDGNELGGMWEGRPTEVHLLPGKHVIDVRYESPMQGGILLIPLIEMFRPHFEKTLELEVEQGHEYSVRFYKFTNGSVWMTKWKDVVYWIEDGQTGKVISGQVPSEVSENYPPFSRCPKRALCDEAIKTRAQ